MLPEATAQFARLAEKVWDIDAANRTEEELTASFVDALAAFIREIGLPTTLAEMGISNDTDYRAIAESTVLTGGCAKKFTSDELYDILQECRE